MARPRMLLAGINHLQVPVAAREKAAVQSGELLEALSSLKSLAGLAEAVVLSTCSRVEIYGAAGDSAAAEAALRGWFERRAGEEVSSRLYVRHGGAAVGHLFRVAAGLDSWIVGEPEILGQVKRAYQASLEAGCTGGILNRAFQKAVAAGKEVRTVTGIQNGIHSIGGAAALLSKEIFSGGQDGSVVVFGAGEAAEAVVRHLAAKSFKRIAVANRSLDRAAALARKLGAEAVSLEEGLRRLASAEIGVWSTACSRPLLERGALASLVKIRRRPLFLIDLGLPRNVDPDCAGLPGVYLYNLDDLKGVVARSMERKTSERAKAESMAVKAALECAGEIERAAGAFGRPRTLTEMAS